MPSNRLSATSHTIISTLGLKIFPQGPHGRWRGPRDVAVLLPDEANYRTAERVIPFLMLVVGLKRTWNSMNGLVIWSDSVIYPQHAAVVSANSYGEMWRRLKDTEKLYKRRLEDFSRASEEVLALSKCMRDRLGGEDYVQRSWEWITRMVRIVLFPRFVCL